MCSTQKNRAEIRGGALPPPPPQEGLLSPVADSSNFHFQKGARLKCCWRKAAPCLAGLGVPTSLLLSGRRPLPSMGHVWRRQKDT